MSDSRQAYDEQLPWLEAVDDEDGPGGVPARRMLAALLVVLLAVGLVAATFFWIGRRDVGETAGAPELIRAEAGPYKSSQSTQADWTLRAIARLRSKRAPDRILTPNSISARRRKSRWRPRNPFRHPSPLSPTTRQGREAAAAEPEPAPTGGKGSVIQLGAFANRAQAERAWSALSARFSIGRVDDQAGHSVLGRHSASRGGGISGGSQAGMPGAQGRRRKLLRGELMQAAIYGLEGTEITAEERDFFRDADPAGYILFKRNCCDREQMRRVTDGFASYPASRTSRS